MTLCALGLLPATSGLAQYTFSTIAGIANQPGSQNGSGGGIASTLFNGPFAIAVAGDGTLFVTDANNSVIRKITAAGTVSTFAGTAGTLGVSNGTSTDPAITFDLPQGAVLDSAGNLYVSDYGGATIRKITSSGTVTTLAGIAFTTGFANGTGTAASFNRPSSLAIDSVGNIFVADSGNNCIRKITPAGVVTTATGTDTAGLIGPRGIAVDSAGNLYIADTANNCIRKVTSAGVVTTLAGKAVTFGSTDGTGEDARFSFPNSLALDSSGNLYVADEGNASIRKITPAGVVTTIAGLSGTTGRVDGPATSVARFDHPTTVALDSSGNIYVADFGNQLVRKITSGGNVVTIAGTGGQTGMQNGTGYLVNPSGFRNPTSAVVDSSGNLFVVDAGNHSIRKITTAGVVSLFAGNGVGLGSIDGNGSVARFNSPSGIAISAAGNLYVADTGNQTIRQISPSGDVTTYAGTVTNTGALDGDRSVATFRNPGGVAVDGSGNVFVADSGNHVIRMISLSGAVTTLAGSAGAQGSSDGVGSAARFSFPRDVAVDASGNVYVADSGNHTIRRISPGGLVMTLAGSAGSAGSANGSGSSARFNGPSGVGVDTAGNIYVADSGNSTLRMITAAGVVSTIGGSAGSVGTLDGVGTAALFNFPSDIALDAAGNLFVMDNRNHTIRKGTLPGGSGGSGSGGSGSGSGGSGGSGGTGGTGSGSGTGSSAGDGAFSGGSVGTGFVSHPVGVIADSAGSVYVCDTANHCIRKIVGGLVTTIAGKAGAAGTADGKGENARFNNPTAITGDGSGNVYVADTGNSTIRKVTSDGEVTTLAGTAGATGTVDGVGSAARFNSPKGIVLVVNGSTTAVELYVADSANNTIRKILLADSTVSTLAGVAGTTGDADGSGSAARFNNPTGLANDLTGALVVADTYNNTIRSIRTTDLTSTAADGVTVVVTQPAGTTSTIAGVAGISGAYDGTGANALFNLPQGVAVSSVTGSIFVADTGNSIIRRINATTRVVATVAGIAGISGNRSGGADQALFNQPQGLYSYASNLLVVSDTGNSIMRTVSFPASATAAGGTTVTTTVLTDTTTTSSTGSGSSSSSSGGYGGGGAPNLDFVAALGLLVAIRAFSRRKAA